MVFSDLVSELPIVAQLSGSGVHKAGRRFHVHPVEILQVRFLYVIVHALVCEYPENVLQW